MLKELIIFSCGAAAGAGACYFLVRKKFNEEVAKKVEEERKELRSFYKKKADDESKKRVENLMEEEVKERTTYHNLTRPYIPSEERKPSIYDVLAKSASSSKQEVKNDSAEKYEDVPRDEKHDLPYGITPEDFANTCEYYDKTSLTYYKGDGVVADEDGEIVIDAGSILGYDFADKIGEFEGGVAYIRNESIGADYEVTEEKGSYYNY